MKAIIGFWLILIFSTSKAIGQTDLDYIDFENEGELTNVIETENSTVLMRRYNLNLVSKEFLTTQLDISLESANAIISHRDKFGDFVSIYELQRIPTLTEMETDVLIKNCTLRRTETTSTSPLINSNQFNLDGLITSKLKHNGRLINNRKFSHRYKISYHSINGIKAKLKLEQDAGESFNFSNKQPGFDFIGGFISFKKKNSELIFGDYNLSYGQGLVSWGAFSLPAGLNPEMAPKNKNTITGNGGFLEYKILRGVTYQYENKKNKVISWYSSNLEDSKSVLDQKSPFNSIKFNGYHASESELNLKNKITLKSTGILYQHRFDNLTIGGAVNHNQAIAIDQHEIIQNKNHISLFGNYYTPSTIYFFEIAEEFNSKNKGIILGSINSLSNNSTLTLIGRHFDKDFNPVFSNPLKYKTMGKRESAVYIGYLFEWENGMEFRSFLDFGQYESNQLESPPQFLVWASQFSKFISTNVETGIRAKIKSTYESFTNDRLIELSLFENFKIHENQVRIRSLISKGISSPKKSFSFIIRHKAETSGRLHAETTVAYINAPSNSPVQYYFDGGDGFGGAIWRLSGEGFRLNLGWKYKISRDLSLGLAIRSTWVINQYTSTYSGPLQSEFRVKVSYKK